MHPNLNHLWPLDAPFTLLPLPTKQPITWLSHNSYSLPSLHSPPWQQDGAGRWVPTSGPAAVLPSSTAASAICAFLLLLTGHITLFVGHSSFAALQETQALLQRLQQPTAETVALEYSNINRLTTWIGATVVITAPGLVPAISLPRKQFNTLMQQWCIIAKPLLLLLTDMHALSQPGFEAISGAGEPLSHIANLLECWVHSAADGEAVKQRIAQLLAGKWRVCVHVGGWAAEVGGGGCKQVLGGRNTVDTTIKAAQCSVVLQVEWGSGQQGGLDGCGQQVFWAFSGAVCQHQGRLPIWAGWT